MAKISMSGQLISHKWDHRSYEILSNDLSGSDKLFLYKDKLPKKIEAHLLTN